MEGGSLAARGEALPMQIMRNDGDLNLGGSVRNSNDATMEQYENIFGPAARDIKIDNQRHKRHQRWHLPDVLKGPNTFLTDRVDGLITDATNSPFTRNILPYVYLENPDQKLKWNVYSFDEGIASRVPYESAARVLPQTKRTFAGYVVRHGLAIAMEHNFMVSEAGRTNFKRQLMQLVGSIQLTNDFDVHVALLQAPSYQTHMDEKYHDTETTLASFYRTYTDQFGMLQKNPNALDILIEDAKKHIRLWGGQPPTFLLCNGAITAQLTMLPEKTNYLTNGPDGKKLLKQGPELPSYRGLNIIHTRAFSLEEGSQPRDISRRRVRVSQHYWVNETFYVKGLFHDDLTEKALLEQNPKLTGNPNEEIQFVSHDGATKTDGPQIQLYDQSTDSMVTLDASTLWKMGFGDLKVSTAEKYFKNFIAHQPYGVKADSAGFSRDLPTAPDSLDVYQYKISLGKMEYTYTHPGSGPSGAQKLDVLPHKWHFLIIRPSIEHYMLGGIIGRGGTQELGCTFWGQTELSCYDDAQHGIWGMSYKYHERAMVLNEKNMVRLYDIAFDGYVGGMDTTHVPFKTDDTSYKRIPITEDWREQMYDRTQPYRGPSMIVIPVPVPKNVENGNSLPNPLIMDLTRSSTQYNTSRNMPSTPPDRFKKVFGEKDLQKHTLHKTGLNEHTWGKCMEDYIDVALRISNLELSSYSQLMQSVGTAGSTSIENMTDVNNMSYHGQLTIISAPTNNIAGTKTVRGSGHLGPCYEGVASVREGRGVNMTMDAKVQMSHMI